MFTIKVKLGTVDATLVSDEGITNHPTLVGAVETTRLIVGHWAILDADEGAVVTSSDTADEIASALHAEGTPYVGCVKALYTKAGGLGNAVHAAQRAYGRC